MKYLFLILSIAVFIGCANPENSSAPEPKSKLSDLKIVFSSNESVTLDKAFGSVSPGNYDYSYTCQNCVVNGNSYAHYGCWSHGSWKDLNIGNNRGKVCIRVESTSCSHNFKGLIVSYEYSLMENYAGKHVTVMNENIWDKDCNF